MQYLQHLAMLLPSGLILVPQIFEMLVYSGVVGGGGVNPVVVVVVVVVPPSIAVIAGVLCVYMG